MTLPAIGRRIADLRAALKMSNKELSVRTGIPTTILSQLVHARRKSISTTDVWRIAKALGVTTDYIIYGNRTGLPADLQLKLPPED